MLREHRGRMLCDAQSLDWREILASDRKKHVSATRRLFLLLQLEREGMTGLHSCVLFPPAEQQKWFMYVAAQQGWEGPRGAHIAAMLKSQFRANACWTRPPSANEPSNAQRTTKPLGWRIDGRLSRLLFLLNRPGWVYGWTLRGQRRCLSQAEVGRGPGQGRERIGALEQYID
jgi:hypothetical protein